MPLIKLIAFDMDGTLYNSENIIDIAFENAIYKINKVYNLNIKCPKKSDIIFQLGNPVNIIFKNLFSDLKDEVRKELEKLELEELLKLIEEKRGELIPDVIDVIPKLAKYYKLVIASNGRREYLETVLKTYDLSVFFEDLIVIDNKTIINKGDILKSYMNKYNFSFIEVIMIGDRESDMKAALENNTWFIGYLNGHSKKNEIDNASYKIENLNEIFDIINLIEKRIIYL